MTAGNIKLEPLYRKCIKQMYDLLYADILDHNGFNFGSHAELTDLDLETITSCFVAD